MTLPWSGSNHQPPRLGANYNATQSGSFLNPLQFFKQHFVLTSSCFCSSHIVTHNYICSYSMLHLLWIKIFLTLMLSGQNCIEFHHHLIFFELILEYKCGVLLSVSLIVASSFVCSTKLWGGIIGRGMAVALCWLGQLWMGDGMRWWWIAVLKIWREEWVRRECGSWFHR